MRRVTVTIPDDLERELEAYLRRQDAPPSITTVMQVAMREFLASQKLRDRGYQIARKAFSLRPLEEKDDRGEPDVSIAHDKYFAR
jgi:hypothetical protein